MSKIKIRLSRHIFRNCETKELGCWAHLDMKLPYAPFPGLVIHDGKGDIMKIKTVKFDNSDKITHCLVEAEYHSDYEYAKQMAIEWGWKIREVPEGKFSENVENLF